MDGPVFPCLQNGRQTELLYGRYRNDDGRIDYQYDAFGRLNEKTYSFHLRSDSNQVYANTVGYTFTSAGNNTSAQIRTFTSQVGNNAAVTWTYTYDGNGNITKVTASNRTEYRRR